MRLEVEYNVHILDRLFGQCIAWAKRTDVESHTQINIIVNKQEQKNKPLLNSLLPELNKQQS
jgi:hypothetical protein